MCLGVPGRIVSIEGLEAVVEFGGVCRPVRLDVVDSEVRLGDFVLNHVGFAIRRIPPEEVEATLALYEQLLEHVREELRQEAALGRPQNEDSDGESA